MNHHPVQKRETMPNQKRKTDVAAKMNELASGLEAAKRTDVNAQNLLDNAIATAVRERTAQLAKQKDAQAAAIAEAKQAVGACNRNFSGTCPKGWTFANDLCVAPAGSPCRDLDLRHANEHDLVQVSYACGAEWPCADGDLY